MITILVSPNEDSKVKQALGEMGFEFPIPYDFQLFTNNGIISRERKVYPEDLISSIGDGRLGRECAAMRERSQFPGVILEGRAHFTKEGYLKVGSRSTRWSRQGLHNILRSIKYVEGCDIDFTDDISDTVECLRETQSYFDNTDHSSLRTRPRFQSNWLVPTYEERYIYWLQGYPTVSVHRAQAIAQVYPNPMAFLGAVFGDLGQPSIDSLLKVSGIAKGVGGAIIRFLEKKVESNQEL